MVVYCEREEEIIRIISARKATKKEIQDYQGGKKKSGTHPKIGTRS